MNHDTEYERDLTNDECVELELREIRQQHLRHQQRHATLERQHRAAEHKLLCHPDGSKCKDGCAKQQQWCRCGDIRGEMRHSTGWLVCGNCKRAIGGG